MAETLQHDQAALIARLSTTCATDDEPVPDTARSGRANAIISPSRWYKKSVRPSGSWRSADVFGSPITSTATPVSTATEQQNDYDDYQEQFHGNGPFRQGHFCCFPVSVRSKGGDHDSQHCVQGCRHEELRLQS